MASLFTIDKRWKQPMSIDEWMNVVYTYNGVLFIFKKEENSDTYYSMDEP